MHDFCTYFDENYLARGLSLYDSLRRHCPDFRLWVLCMTPVAFHALTALDLPGLRPIRLEELEHGDTDLLAAKANRSRIEYYFTCTPSLPLHILNHWADVREITYLDADLFFFSDPGPVFAEVGEASVAIIAHRFPPNLRHLEKFGVYNVGWLTFKRDETGLACLNWWRTQCNGWCYDRVENGRFADQKYLDGWPQRFKRVVVLQHKGANLAPWNLGNYSIGWRDETVRVDEDPLIFFHFHGFKQSASGSFDFNLRPYGVNFDSVTARYIYGPYIQALQRSIEQTRPCMGSSAPTAGIRGTPNGPKTPLPAKCEPEPPVPCGSPVAKGSHVLSAEVCQARAMSTEESLLRMRSDLAGFWLKLPAAELEHYYGGEAGSLHKKLAIGCLKDRLLTADERRLSEHAVNRIRAGAEGLELARCFLVAMLHLNAHQLPPNLDSMKLPHWLRDDAFRFQLTFPNILHQAGEADAYCEHLDRVTVRLHEGLHSTTPAPWQQMAITFAEKANFQPLYFSQRNPKPIVERRAAIVDYATRLKRHDLDYRVPSRPKGTQRIRLGIHSWSIRPHTETFATLPIFSALDPLQFDIRLYIHQSDGNPVEKRARGLAQSVTVLPEMLKACVETIRSDDLDILVFGNNITAGSSYAFSLANYRMARVQCIHFCNPVTSGKRHVDCFLLGKLIADHLNTEAHFSERIIAMAGSGICFDLPDTPGEVQSALSRSELGIASGSPVFISGANYFKIIPELQHTWAKILAQVPDSVLLLYPFGPAWSPTYPQRRLLEGISRVFEQYGVRSERLILMDTLKGREDILALNRIADVYLDAVPYNGATSLLDPLQEGVPPVVLDGRELRFAQGAAILRELGLPELVTRDEDEYIRLAIRLATDAAAREATRRAIRERMGSTPAFLNPRLYSERVAAAFKTLFPNTEHVPRRSISKSSPRVDGVERTAS